MRNWGHHLEVERPIWRADGARREGARKVPQPCARRRCGASQGWSCRSGRSAEPCKGGGLAGGGTTWGHLGRSSGTWRLDGTHHDGRCWVGSCAPSCYLAHLLPPARCARGTGAAPSRTPVRAHTNATSDVHAAADAHVVAEVATADAPESSGCDLDGATSGSDSDEHEESDARDEGNVAEPEPDRDAQGSQCYCTCSVMRRTCCVCTCLAEPLPPPCSLAADEYIFAKLA
eukprot:356191-Chlamydomonas_euryale.AAC.9